MFILAIITSSLPDLDQCSGTTWLCGPSYQSLTAASLSLGYRYIRMGAFVRHVPNLIHDNR